MNKKQREIEECYLLYDYPKRGRIPNAKLQELMNCLGHNANPKHLESLIQKADSNGQGSFTMEGFKRVMEEVSSANYTKEDLVSAFELLDRDSDGLISKGDLKAASKVLLGEELTQDKVDFMFNNLKTEGDKIKFEEFKMLLD